MYYCTNCGSEFPKWSGKCPVCNQWDTIAEAPDAVKGKGNKSDRVARVASKVSLKELSTQKTMKLERLSSGFNEFDRVMGGGIVPGSITLVAGEPGIGKSTILLQIALKLSLIGKVLYVSGEESIAQIHSRVLRIDNKPSYSKYSLILSDETNAESIVYETKTCATILAIFCSIFIWRSYDA